MYQHVVDVDYIYGRLLLDRLIQESKTACSLDLTKLIFNCQKIKLNSLLYMIYFYKYPNLILTNRKIPMLLLMCCLIVAV